MYGTLKKIIKNKNVSIGIFKWCNVLHFFELSTLQFPKINSLLSKNE